MGVIGDEQFSAAAAGLRRRYILAVNGTPIGFGMNSRTVKANGQEEYVCFNIRDGALDHFKCNVLMKTGQIGASAYEHFLIRKEYTFGREYYRWCWIWYDVLKDYCKAV